MGQRKEKFCLLSATVADGGANRDKQVLPATYDCGESCDVTGCAYVLLVLNILSCNKYRTITTYYGANSIHASVYIRQENVFDRTLQIVVSVNYYPTSTGSQFCMFEYFLQRVERDPGYKTDGLGFQPCSYPDLRRRHDIIPSPMRELGCGELLQRNFIFLFFFLTDIVVMAEG